jgi:hypothetical protein
MGFNQDQFMKQQYEPRTACVEVPLLADFFGKDEKPVWELRGQTASELARTIEASNNQKSITSIIEAIGNNQTQIDDIKKAIGISDDVPQDIIKRLNQFVTCSVNPEIDQMCAVKFAETFPIEFYILTNKVTELTGLGMTVAVKKQKGSGKIMK